MSNDSTRPDKPRRILMLIPQLGYGGAQGALGRLADTFVASGHSVTVAMFRRHNSLHSDGGVVPRARLVVLDPETGGGGRFARWIRRIRTFRALKYEHDVSISFLAGANLLNSLTGTRTPTILSERGTKRHDAGMSRRAAFLWPNVLDPLAYRRADRVVAASRGLMAEITGADFRPEAQRAQAPATPDENIAKDGKFVTIAGYADAPALVEAADDRIEADFETLAGRDLIVACGRAHRNKGFMQLIEAMAEVKVRHPPAQLMILGDGPLLGPMQARCAQLGLSWRERPAQGAADVYLPGFRERPVRYFRLAKVFAFPSVSEGLPNVVLEALAAGMPLLAADCPHGPREILFDWPGPPFQALPCPSPLGTLMPMIPEAPQAWVDALSAALARPASSRPGPQARLAAVAPFDVRRSNRAWQDLIDTVCNDERKD